MELTVKPFIANMKIHYNSFNKFEIVFRPFFPNLIQLIPNPTQNNKGSTSEVKDRREEITTEKNLETKTTNVEEKTKTDRRRKRSNNEEQEELSKKRKTEEKMEISDE